MKRRIHILAEQIYKLPRNHRDDNNIPTCYCDQAMRRNGVWCVQCLMVVDVVVNAAIKAEREACAQLISHKADEISADGIHWVAQELDGLAVKVRAREKGLKK